MKLINAVVVVCKLVLFFAGLVFLAHRIRGALNDDQYKFDVDSMFNSEEKRTKPQSGTAREADVRFMQNMFYESMNA